jgi:hypothetical protein
MLVDSTNIDLPNVNLPRFVYNELKMHFFWSEHNFAT